mgnify:CR=1 FL=1
MAKLITKIIDWLYDKLSRIELFRRYFSRQFFRYGVCGTGNMVLDWVLYFIVYNFIIGHELIYIRLFHQQLCLTPHIASLCVVFPITLFTGFWLNKYVTFTASYLPSAKQLTRYVSIVILNLAINYFGLKLLVEVLNFYPTPSKMLITVITVAISYFGQKYFSFKS